MTKPVDSAYMMSERVPKTPISQKDVTYLEKLLRERRAGNTPSCPFSAVKITANQGKKQIDIHPATDGCHLVKIQDKFVQMDNHAWKEFAAFVSRYGITSSELAHSGI